MQQSVQQAEWHELDNKVINSESWSHASILWTKQINNKTFNYIVTFGGFSNKESTKNREPSLLVFSLDKHELVDFKANSALPNRGGHTLCLDQSNTLLLFGGIDSSGKMMGSGGPTRITISINDYGDIISVQYKEMGIWHYGLGAGLILFRKYHTVHFYQQKMYTYGGRDENNRLVNNLHMFFTSTESWALCNPTGDFPVAREKHSSILSNDKIYVFGGYSDQFLNDINALSLTEMKWTKIVVQGLTPSLGLGIAIQVVENHVYLFGGQTTENKFNDHVLAFSLNEHTWKQLDRNGQAPKSRAFSTMVGWKNSLYAIGGKNNDQVFGETYILEIYNNFQEHKIFSGKIALKDLFLDKEFADIIFKVEGQEFPCHKAILCKASQYFRNMFTSGMSESQSHEIVLSNIKASTFKALLAHVYSKDDMILTEEIALDLLPLTEEYQLPDLKSECERVLGGALRLGNYHKIANVVEINEAEQLNEAVLKFIHENWNVIRSRKNFSKELLDLSKEFLLEIMSKLNS